MSASEADNFMRGRWTFAIALAAAVLAAFASSLTKPAAATADDSPCGSVVNKSIGAVQYCPIWMPARGYVPVHQFASDGTPVEKGRLDVAGTANWFVCESRTPDGFTPPIYSDPDHPYSNGWWAKTLSDDGVWGWTNEVYFSGGEDDEADAGLRACSGGAAPPTGGPTGTSATEDPSGCEKTVENQRVTMSLSATEWNERIFESGGGPPSSGGEYGHEHFDGGKVEVTVATCLTPEDDWRIIRPISAAVFPHGITIEEGLTEDRAIVPAIRSYSVDTDEDDPLEKGQVTVEIADCSDSERWDTFEKIVTFPLPGVSYLVDVAQYIAGGWLIPEDKAVCEKLGTLEMGLQVTDYASGGSCRPIADRIPLPCKAVAKPDGKPGGGKPGKHWRPAKRWQKVKVKGGKGADRAQTKWKWTARGWKETGGSLIAKPDSAVFSETSPEGAGCTSPNNCVSNKTSLEAELGY